MTARSCLSGCILAAILWLVIGLIFAAGLAVGRATASVPYRWSPTSSSALHAIPTVFLGVDESDRGARSGAPLDPAIAQLAERRSLVLGPPTEVAEAESARGANGGAPSPAGRTSTGERSTPTPATLVGLASWYRDPTAAPDAEYVALPGFTTDRLGEHVLVTGFIDGRSISITVAVVTSCQCLVETAHPRIIDLAPSVFLQVCGPLSKGLCRVTVLVLR